MGRLWPVPLEGANDLGDEERLRGGSFPAEPVAGSHHSTLAYSSSVPWVPPSVIWGTVMMIKLESSFLLPSPPEAAATAEMVQIGAFTHPLL